MILVRFLAVGASAAALQFLVLWLLLHGAGLPYQPATLLAYAASVVFHFLANRYFTFRASASPRGPQMLRYGVLLVLNGALTLGIVTACVEWAGTTPYAATLVAIGATVMVGFGLSRYWVFAPVPAGTERSHG